MWQSAMRASALCALACGPATVLAQNVPQQADHRPHGDVATASPLEVWIDEAEKRVWFLFEAGRTQPH
jgi:hypothetical protein